MSMPLSAATAARAGLERTASIELSHLKSQREQLTFHLRSLAAELDSLDRRLSDLDWQLHRQHSDAVDTELSRERNALDSQRAHMTSRLRGLARELNDLDMRLVSRSGRPPTHAPRVGTCPDCGYPSLDSGLCAFCRPRLAR